MTERKGKFGLTYSEMKSARERWKRIITDCEWETFDDYLLWMVESDWQKGMHIGKKNPDKPHGPENSIWVTISEDHASARSCPIPEVGNKFCDNCDLYGKDECLEHHCVKWQNWFRRNWDKNIHGQKPEPPKGREFFVYHHPDDVREGRV